MIGTELAAQVLGMKTSEIRDIDAVQGGALVTTHDGKRHGINDNGEIVPLVGEFAPQPEPVIHHTGAAPQVVPGELIPGTTTTANAAPGEGGLLVPDDEFVLVGDGRGTTLAAVAATIAAEFNLPQAAVLDVLEAEHGNPVPELVTDPVDDELDDEHQGDELSEHQDDDGHDPVDDELDDEHQGDELAGPVDVDAVPTGNADVVLAWVGTDQVRARRALELEEAKTAGKRGTLITKLTRLVSAE